jgi:hypothetical protein
VCVCVCVRACVYVCDIAPARPQGYLRLMGELLEPVAAAFRGKEPEVWAGWTEATLRLWPLCRE